MAKQKKLRTITSKDIAKRRERDAAKFRKKASREAAASLKAEKARTAKQIDKERKRALKERERSKVREKKESQRKSKNQKRIRETAKKKRKAQKERVARAKQIQRAVLGPSQIGVDTGIMRNSSTPGYRGSTTVGTKTRTSANLFEIRGAEVTVGYNSNYAKHFDKVRPLMPERIPRRWQNALDQQAQEWADKITKEVFGAG